MENYLLVAIGLLLVVVLAKRLFVSPTSHDVELEIDPAASDKKPTVFSCFSRQQLSSHNGLDLETIYIAVRGRVYDVSRSRQFYGPSGPYAVFAGNDASRGLALNNFDVASWDQPRLPLDDLDAAALESLDGWEKMFKGKYPCVGKLEED